MPFSPWGQGCCAVTFLIVTLISGFSAGAEAPASAPSATAADRVPWTTSRVTGSPETPLPYVTERVFPALQFNHCLHLVKAPGSNRLFVVEQGGKIFSFPNQPDVKTADLVVDLARQIEGVKEVYSLAFHPNFQTNGFCYVCYIKAPDLRDGSHIARFQVSKTEPPTIDVTTEKTIITWLSGGHNGCCLKFGPDGCLYVSTGDGSGPNPPDALKSGQDLGNLLSSILRLDVDHADGDRNYRIPPDNPFVNHPGARGEIWAYGFRNPWRMSFDTRSGDLWVGDVGWELWELLDRVERGGNYGWSIMEGRQATNPEWARGPTPILPPTIDRPHSESSSITDGLTYAGSRLPELTGHHIYGDYDTGKIWAFRYENGKVLDHREIADTTHRIVSFGDDHAGECYILDHTAGSIQRLISNPKRHEKSTFPLKLSDSGIFGQVSGQVPAAGVFPYLINVESWADYATATRFLGLPGNTVIQNRGNEWTFPKDTVFVKTLSLDLKQGDPQSRQKIETQILHFDGTDWQPYTYQWNAEQSDAELVPAVGSEKVFEIADSDAPGGVRRQTWHFAARAECQRCHNKWSGSTLAFNPVQLNRPLAHGNQAIMELDRLVQLNLFEKRVPVENRPSLVNPCDQSASLDQRARAYLHANCSHCHRMHAGGAVLSKMHYDLPLDKTDMVKARPSQGTFGIHAAQVIAPGDPNGSVLLYRMSKLGSGHMPHLGSSEIDRSGVLLIREWIENLPRDTVPETAGNQSLAALRSREKATLAQLIASMKAQDRENLLGQILSTTSGALMLLGALDQGRVPADLVPLVVEKAGGHHDVSVRDLYERFLPPEKRVKRLGSIVQPAQILSLPGDADRGRKVFFENAGVTCRNCHRIGQEGKEVGPDLTTIGKKSSRVQLLESILEPSKLIDPKYVTYLAETTEGRIVMGVLISKDAAEIKLRDAQDQVIRIPVTQVEQLVPQRQSLMPELLLRDMTAQQVADLLEFLSSLK